MVGSSSFALRVAMTTRFLVAALVLVLLTESSAATMFSARLIHRFSDEVRDFRTARSGGVPGSWPEWRTMEYYKMLVRSDLERQKVTLGSKYQFLFPSEGSKTMSLGCITLGLISGAPIFLFSSRWTLGVIYYGFHAIVYNALPYPPAIMVVWCSLIFGASMMQDRDLNQYSPSGSSTSKHLSCSHQLCESSPHCNSPKQPCPYIVNYYSENTSSSGLLIEDILHLASSSNDMSNSSVRAPVIIGCGMKQTGGYLDGVAPDGLMGLGLGEISVPSLLAKAGLVKNSFSLCFDENDSGRIFFGDQGLATQQSTLFLPSEGKYETYIVGIEAWCIGNYCIEQTSFSALVDSGTSFTFLPHQPYRKIVDEFDRQVNTTRFSFEGYPWEYCYKSSSKELLKNPAVMLKFAMNNSFVVLNPVFVVHGYEGAVGFCLAIGPIDGDIGIIGPVGFCLAIGPIDGDIGIIGQNFMTGYRMAFDRENLKLGWSRSHCQDLAEGEKMPLTPPPKNRQLTPLPTNEQQSTPSGHKISPAVAGRASPSASAASTQQISWQFCLVKSLPLILLLLHLLPSAF